MARKRTSRRNEDVADFAGPDANKEAIEKLANAAAAENKKRGTKGKNVGEASDETVGMHVNLIKAAEVELDELLAEVSKKRGVLGNHKKVAKKDGCDIDAIMLALKLEKRASTGGSSPIVTEHRNIGRVLRILNVPLYTQFRLFDLPEDAAAPDAPKDEKALEAEATLAGEHAGLNGEPKENCPHQAGTALAFAWRNGHQIGADKLTDSFRTGKAPAPAGAAAH